MSRYGAERESEMWWVEGRGYQEERKLSQKVRTAKDSLKQVLEHYGYFRDQGWPETQFVKIICPFHDDRHPSATINRRYFRCWACNTKGSAIDLVMDQENMSFLEAVEFIVGL